MTRFSTAKDLVLLHFRDIVPELFGGGKKQTRLISRPGGDVWQVANPWRPGSDLSEMKIWPGGAWKDFNNGEKGDAMDLVAYGLAGIITKDSRMRALEWVENRFGIRAMAPEALDKLKREGEERRATLDMEAEKVAQANRERSRKAFYGAHPAILDTPAETYLRWRGIRIREIENLANSFRFRPDCDYWPAKEFGAGDTERSFPGMLSAMVDNGGRLGAVHYTLLEPEGNRKLDTLSRGWVDEKPDGRIKGKSPKLMFPDTAGLVVRVTRGPSGLTCEEAASKGELDWFGITEGIEDALSVASAEPLLRMHAAGSLPGYLHLPDHPAARGYLLFRDNDWDKPQAVELFDRAEARLKEFGKPVQVIAMDPAWGKDANDVLNLKE